jgi:glycosyltransferase involved in cell wall biosynthesis
MRHGALPAVTLATRVYAPEQAAAAFRLAALVDALQAVPARVRVLTARPPRGLPRADSTGVSRWPALRDSAGYLRGYLPYLSFDGPLVIRMIGERDADVVVVEPPPTTGAVVRAVLAVRRLVTGRRVPYVYYAADVWSDASAATSAPAAVVRLLRLLERFALGGAQEVLAISPAVADRVRALGARSVHVVPNGVDTGVFSPEGQQGERARHGMPDGPFLLYAGTASEWQGAHIFAEAMRQVVRSVPTATLVYLGRGTGWDAVQQIAGDLPPGTVELRHVVPAPVAAAWHRQASAALVSIRPTAGYDMAYPTKVLAALACGAAVVYAGPGPAVTDLRTDRLGCAVPYDVDAVASAMIDALQSAPSGSEAQRRARWVREHRSLRASADAAARIVLEAATRAG